MIASKNMLCILQIPPYTGLRNEEWLDFTLAGEGLNANVSVLFEGKGVLNLSSKIAAPEGRKNFLEMLAMLALVDIPLFAEHEAMAKYGIKDSDLLEGLQAIEDIEQFKKQFTFLFHG